jgi:membrane-bound serine protease (ClpP class)
MRRWRRFRHRPGNGMHVTPTLAFTGAALGALAIYIEFVRPGKLVPGLAGAALLAWGGYVLSRFPVDYGALGIIAVGLALLLGETAWNSRFVGGVLGTLALAFGSARLITGPALISAPVAWILAIVFGVVSTVLAATARQARRNKRADLTKS